MMTSYSNNPVKVLTSIIVGIIGKDKNGINKIKGFRQDNVTSVVYFQELTEDIRNDYLDTGEDNSLYKSSGGFCILEKQRH